MLDGLDDALDRMVGDWTQTLLASLALLRLEAVRAGFKRACQARDYGTIITVAEKIPQSVLQEDPKLLMCTTRR